MNYEVTYFYGERDNESTIYIHDVETVAYDNEVVIFYAKDNKPLLIIRYPKYRIVRIPEL